MLRNIGYWDDMEETGLRLCPEDPIKVYTDTMEVTACCWHPSNPDTIGVCSNDGSFVLVPNITTREESVPTASRAYAVYFNTLPVHLWGRAQRGGSGAIGQDSRDSRALQAPARRVRHAWSQVALVPGQEGEVIFVQGWSPRVLLTTLPKGSEGSARTIDPDSSSRGFLNGSRVIALSGHESQVQCMAIDNRGSLLVTGDESGAIFARILHHRNSKSAHQPPQRDRDGTQFGGGRSSSGNTGDGNATAVASAAAHEGGVLAVSHVDDRPSRISGNEDSDSEPKDEEMLFVSGGQGGIVRLWRATYGLAGHAGQTGSVMRLRLRVLMDMHIGGCQVSSLATCPSYRAPLVVVGCNEGIVFGFALEPLVDAPASDGPFTSAGEMGRLLTKLEHTSRRITSVTCSREQELIATADTDGIVRTYRPLSLRGANCSDSVHDVDSVSVVDGLPPWQLELIVECRLGSSPVACEFAMEKENALASKEAKDKGGGIEREVLRTCTRDGVRVRVWPGADLPTRPLRPLPLQPLSSPPPPPQPNPTEHTPVRMPTHDRPTQTRYMAGSNNMGQPPRSFGAEDRFHHHQQQQQQRQSVDPKEAFVGEEGVEGFFAEEYKATSRGNVDEGEEEEEEPVPRASLPVPGLGPTTPRRVSFASAEQVYKYSVDSGNRKEDDESESSFAMYSNGTQEKGDCNNVLEEEKEEQPRPPPPAPTPQSSGPSYPGRLRQHWGTNLVRREGRLPADAATGGQEGAFVPPSDLQEPSLLSTMMEQAALERRMEEEFDSRATLERLNQPAYRGPAASVVNIHPLAKTFEGLVPVSLDAPPPRPKRMGKQVSRAHLSRVEEGRITEQDLLFDGVEPAVCSIAPEIGIDTSRTVWPQVEWYGGRPAYSQKEDASFVSDRIWSWSLRP